MKYQQYILVHDPNYNYYLPIITMHKISLVRSFPIHITAFENEIKCNWVDQYKKQ